MEIINGMKIFTLDDITERKFGPIGTPERDAFEREMELMEIRHQAALKAAQTRKRNREEALRLTKEKQKPTNTIEYIVKIETDSRQDDLPQVPLDLLIEQEKHLPLNR